MRGEAMRDEIPANPISYPLKRLNKISFLRVMRGLAGSFFFLRRKNRINKYEKNNARRRWPDGRSGAGVARGGGAVPLPVTRNTPHSPHFLTTMAGEVLMPGTSSAPCARPAP
jgi:hypothetical protein